MSQLFRISLTGGDGQCVPSHKNSKNEASVVPSLAGVPKPKRGTYFFTQVTYQRRPRLCHDIARTTLRQAINKVRQTYPFAIEALVLLPDHLHCLWTLPEGDSDYATRWRLIKTFVTKHCASELAIETKITASREKRKEGNLCTSIRENVPKS